MKGKHKVFLVLALSFVLVIAGIGLAVPTRAQVQAEKSVQVQQPKRKIGNHVTGGLIQNLKPNEDISTEMQSNDSDGSLGSSGSTATQGNKKIVSASSLPTLWNPLNTSSGNYNKVSPVLDQQDLENCWDYAGISAISDSSYKQLGSYQNLLPAYYDYLSAGNAFIGVKNPLAIMLADVRQLGDGNTEDYVPSMSLLGYGPYLPGNGLAQLMTQSQDIPIQKSKFDGLTKANSSVSNDYKLTGLTTSQLPSTANIMSRVNQIKQLVYQYGAIAWYGVK